ncbi:hypothetical protein NPIL_236341 [Nephila pilipes]|uniref:Uncharacterized protein n=1 Tax=Nephila pilipes TaxID=299642 RepID=A0A8X6TBY0_NEPPI|nr:hypothetical protein NPIL_236341 [Nephila pilipes]
MFSNEATVSSEEVYNTQHEHKWALNNPNRNRTRASEQSFIVNMGTSVVAENLAGPCIFQLELTLASISPFFRRLYQKCLTISLHMSDAECGFNMIEGHLIT